jgi:2,4-dienoyl-CoA reductase-like NADH-dependent reductase (Old Yellow Enzyme family)
MCARSGDEQQGRRLMQTLPFIAPGQLGTLKLRNRLVRAPTSETMATADGLATDELIEHYRKLAAGGAGLLITGHIFIEANGKYEAWQLGLHHDGCIAPLTKVTQVVHAHGAAIFAELAHAGSQSTLPDIVPISPSVVPNAIHERAPVEMTETDILRIVDAFAAAAARAKAAGFDGIHIHSGNGYLLPQFNSPLTNRRTDGWGGDADRRSRFLFSVYRAIRNAVGPDMPITARFGVADVVAGGLTVEESVQRVAQLAELGLNGVEPTYNIMTSYRENIRPYVGNTLGHALGDLLVHQLLSAPVAEAYYRPFARAIKAASSIPVLLVGGLRTTDTMSEIIESGDADFLSLCRPLIREPDLPNQIVAGRRGMVDCVSCNLCFKHEGLDPLQCWRTPKTRLLSHIQKFYFRR